jgi:uncharacterized protein
VSSIPPVISVPVRGTLHPVAATERLETLDVLRGFALFGILLVNMAMFGWPVYRSMIPDRGWTTPIDTIADWMVRFLAEGKFYPLFSFLFGLGMALQMQRTEARGARFSGLFCRRLLVLLGIGLAHAFLIWEADILVSYAVCGFLLLAFRKCKPKTLLIWAGIFLLLPSALCVLFWGLFTVGSLLPAIASIIETETASQGAHYARLVEENIRVFSQGSVAEIFAQRAQNVLFMWQLTWFFWPTLLSMFLVGLYAGQRRIPHDVEAHLGVIRRTFLFGLMVGLPASACYATGVGLIDPLKLNVKWLLTTGASTIGGPALGLAYAAGIVLLLRRAGWKKRLWPLTAPGRMALSNYLFQSAIGTTIFYSYGLGWYGSLGKAAGLGFAVMIYAVQVLLSFWWLKHFRSGPVEWLWRTLTYGQRQPIRL